MSFISGNPLWNNILPFKSGEKELAGSTVIAVGTSEQHRDPKFLQNLKSISRNVVRCIIEEDHFVLPPIRICGVQQPDQAVEEERHDSGVGV